ncbi:hypothetical protein BLOT_000320 [Blomia tropicalis]|nr:hypothetical protein BLOT_000320 [Blomia tropicalis]
MRITKLWFIGQQLTESNQICTIVPMSGHKARIVNFMVKAMSVYTFSPFPPSSSSSYIVIRGEHEQLSLSSTE